MATRKATTQSKSQPEESKQPKPKNPSVDSSDYLVMLVDSDGNVINGTAVFGKNCTVRIQELTGQSYGFRI